MIVQKKIQNRRIVVTKFFYTNKIFKTLLHIYIIQIKNNILYDINKPI